MSFTEGGDPGAVPPTGAPPPAMPPEPAAPPPTSGLFGAVQPRDLSLGTAIEVGFRTLGKPAFIGPILAISVVINAIIELTLLPVISRSITFTPSGRPELGDLSALLGALGVTLVVSLIGGLFVAVYGQVWAAAASVGPLPTVGETLRLVGRRWIGVLGASLLVGLMTFGLVAAGAAVIVILAGISDAIAFGVAVGLVIVFVWFVARLFMASWLAADGVGVIASVQASWRLTEGSVLRIVGWSIAYGLLFALLAGALGAVLGQVPLVGAGIGQGIALALGYGAGVTLYRKTQATAPLVGQSGAPTA